MVIANEAHSAELAIYQRACGINIFVPQFRGTLGIKNSDFPITLAYSLPLQEHTLSKKKLKCKKKKNSTAVLSQMLEHARSGYLDCF